MDLTWRERETQKGREEGKWRERWNGNSLKVELTMSPRIKDHGMVYCKKEKKKLSFPLGRCNPAP